MFTRRPRHIIKDVAALHWRYQLERHSAIDDMIFDLPEIVGRDACVELSFVGHRMSPTRSRVVAHGSPATSSKTPTTVQRCEQAKYPQRPTRPHFRGRKRCGQDSEIRSGSTWRRGAYDLPYL